MTGLKHQQGVALLTALAVVALATVAATYMMSAQQLQIRRTGNQLIQEQAWQYALGAEAWAKTILAQDASDNDIDALNENWAIDLPPLPIEGGSLSGRLRDLQGRFNLNNLVNNEGKLVAQSLGQFEQLLEAQGLPVDLAQAIADWQDRDIEAQGGAGAEDDFYAGMETPYRTPNQKISSTSELRLIRGIDAEKLVLLEPLVTALPEPTFLNVNTATAEMFTALGISKEDATQLAERLREDPVESIDDFKKLSEVSKYEIETDKLSVESQYFLLEVTVEIGQIRSRLSSVIYRDKDGISRTIQRSQSVL